MLNLLSRRNFSSRINKNNSEIKIIQNQETYKQDTLGENIIQINQDNIITTKKDCRSSVILMVLRTKNDSSFDIIIDNFDIAKKIVCVNLLKTKNQIKKNKTQEFVEINLENIKDLNNIILEYLENNNVVFLDSDSVDILKQIDLQHKNFSKNIKIFWNNINKVDFITVDKNNNIFDTTKIKNYDLLSLDNITSKQQQMIINKFMNEFKSISIIYMSIIILKNEKELDGEIIKELKEIVNLEDITNSEKIKRLNITLSLMINEYLDKKDDIAKSSNIYELYLYQLQKHKILEYVLGKKLN